VDSPKNSENVGGKPCASPAQVVKTRLPPNMDTDPGETSGNGGGNREIPDPRAGIQSGSRPGSRQQAGQPAAGPGSRQAGRAAGPQAGQAGRRGIGGLWRPGRARLLHLIHGGAFVRCGHQCARRKWRHMATARNGRSANCAQTRNAMCKWRTIIRQTQATWVPPSSRRRVFTSAPRFSGTRARCGPVSATRASI